MKENPISSASVRQLLSLVRASLWQTGIDLKPFRNMAVDWDEIGNLSIQQTVGALAINAALSLPEGLCPPIEWANKGQAILRRIRLSNLLLDSCVVEVAAKLKEGNVPFILLKGQAFARAYPDATLRQCGDIDLYVGKDNFLRAIKLSLQEGWSPKENDAMSDKHYGCKLKGVLIELHRIAGQLPGRQSDMKFQQWSRRMLSGSQNVVVIEGENIPAPPPLFNVIFVFMHLYLHFINGGIGLRHVCDWVMLLHNHYNDIDVEELKKLLNDFGLSRAWRSFTPVAVKYLGLPEKECPLYSPEYIDKARKILSLIIDEGNFGFLRHKTIRRPKGYLAGKTYSFFLVSGLLMRKFQIDPTTAATIYRRYIYNGIGKVFSDITKKKEDS